MKRHGKKVLSIILALVLTAGLATTALAAPSVVISPQNLYVNGTLVLCDKYNINDQNYFKLRDLAAMLDGTDAQFDVSFDQAAQTVSVTTGKAYAAVGGELVTGEDRSGTCVESAWKLTVDGQTVATTAYNLGGNNYFKLRDLGEAIGFGVDYDAPDNFAVITAIDGVLYEHVNDGSTKITDTYFDKYFKEGSAKEGVIALLNAGQFYVNGIKVPSAEDETTTYNVNQVKALWKEDSGWGIQIHKTTTDTNMSFADARLQFVETLTTVRGHTTTLYTDGSGYVTKIDANNIESVLVTEKRDWNEDTVIQRGEFALETNRGVRPDINDLHFNTRYVDQSIQEGDFAVYWYGENGWTIQRALPVKGTLDKVDGKFVIGGDDVRIESNVSRYCLRTANRPTQFFDSYSSLGLGTQEVTVWCTPTGHPIGFTLGERANGKTILGAAIENAKAAKADVAISADGKDVAAGGAWVTQADMDAFDEAIAAAEKVYNTNATPSFGYDQAVYDLAQALGQGGSRPTGFIGAQGEGSGSAAPAPTAAPESTASETRGLQQSAMDGDSYVWVNDGETPITDAAFDQYFDGTAKEGVEALLNAGQFYINGIKVPATDSETATYNVNGVKALYKGDDGWGYQVHKTTTDTNMNFADARLGFVETLTTVRGHTTTLHLTDGKADRIDATNIESVLVTDMIPHGAQSEIKRGDFALETNRGVRPDVDTLSFKIPDNWDDTIEIGDFAVYWYGENGWKIERAVPVKGTVAKVNGEFVINGDDNRIESNVSRYCLRTANRPTQFFDAYTALGLEECAVTVWCTSTGHPIGFTLGDRANGKAVLGVAIENAKAAKAGVAVSADGKDVAKGSSWVTQADMDAFDEAIAAAEKVYSTNATINYQYDQAIYDLAQALGQGGNRPSGFIGAQGEGTK